jgi:hypothetical protein
MANFFNSPAGSWLKAAIVAILSGVLIKLQEGADLWNAASLKELLTIAAVSVIPVIINYLNPQDTRYGKGN